MNVKNLAKTFAVAMLASAGAANAAVITLTSVASIGGSNLFTYQATLGPDEGLRNGDTLVIYDFGGYVAGSLATTFANFTGSAPLLTAGLIVSGQTDDPTINNLLLTYTGPDFRNTGGPFTSLDFDITARSTFATTALDAFTTVTTKNNPANNANTPVFTLGTVLVPASAVPEPATWAMMLGGFGLIGVSRRRRSTVVSA